MEPLHVEVTGDAGSPVLLVMGFCMTGAMWAPVLPALGARHRCATFDHRGTGRSPDGSFDRMSALADDAVGVLDRLQWPTAHVIGVSMGGMVAQEIVLRAPERVRSLALIATHAGGPLAPVPPPSGVGVLLAPTGPVRKLAHLLYPAEVRARIGHATLTERSREQLAQRVPPETRRAQLRAIRHHDTRGRLARIGVRTLIVKPGSDRLVRPAHSDRLVTGIPGARLAILPDAGHGLVYSHAEPLARLLLDHLQGADAADEAASRLR